LPDKIAKIADLKGELTMEILNLVLLTGMAKLFPFSTFKAIFDKARTTFDCKRILDVKVRDINLQAFSNQQGLCRIFSQY